MAGLRRLQDGVCLTGYAPVTDLQRRMAATLTAPRTVLADQNAACHWDFLSREPRAVSVVRPGRRGIERTSTLVVRYSATLDGNVVRRHGLWVTSAERTVIDVWPQFQGRAQARLLREAVRLRHTSVPQLLLALHDHRGRRGVASLREVCALYARLPLGRCRSDAEIEGLVILDAAGVALPEVNEVRAGEEADFSWPERRLIIEIDGPQFHRDPLEDARKARIWSRAGWTVRRISSNDLYNDPRSLVALATR
ncbi:hypothetical protein DSM112329_01049 [Paraconexibacter sp. AEG42_29]|uniref:DUF559 domain-containing protein n=1 Tax=Paraconexibacter sp. AEG42_29 TaxID=2997339 RepID=A0AAU7ARD2_9ACTN